MTITSKKGRPPFAVSEANTAVNNVEGAAMGSPYEARSLQILYMDGTF